MKKNLTMVFLFFALCIIFPQDAQALSKEDAHKAIVKIYSYKQNEAYNLVLEGTGSGIIINEKGVILTNNHVIYSEDAYENEEKLVYKVCITNNSAEAPICNYSAEIIARDEDKDIALLKIKNIGISTKNSFDYLDFGITDYLTPGYEVKVLGYPGIGSETITITSGTVSGKTEKYGSEWIKTDTLISFGSSGGGMINQSGELIGVTTMAKKDFLGSLGYVLSINSIKDWINEHKDEASQASVGGLQAKVEKLIKKQKDLNSQNLFEQDSRQPMYSIEKLDGWKFEYDDEETFSINNSEQDTDAGISVLFSTMPVPQEGKMNGIIKQLKLLINVLKEEDVDFNNVKSKKLTYEFGSDELYQIIMPVNNYFFVLTYFYGENEESKADIEKILSTFKVKETNEKFVLLNNYTNNDPYFTISTPNTWGLQVNYSAINPLYGETVADTGISFDFYLRPLSQTMQGMSNEDYFDYIKDNDLVSDSYEMMGYDTKIFDLDYEYKINNEITNAILYKYEISEPDEEDGVLAYAAGYRIMLEEDVIVVSYFYNSNDKEGFEKSLESFENDVMANLSLGKVKIEENQAKIEESEVDNSENKAIVSGLRKKLAGKIILKVEDKGQAYYINPKDNEMHYLGRPEDAFAVMREQGVGISNQNLYKIPIGITPGGADSDSDGLSDNFEDALGLNKNSNDTDGDGYYDKAELEGGYSPWGTGKQPIDQNFARLQSGKIFLQVENNGEAWFINPDDNKRYFLGRPDDAYNVMRSLGLGISNNNFNEL